MKDLPYEVRVSVRTPSLKWRNFTLFLFRAHHRNAPKVRAAGEVLFISAFNQSLILLKPPSMFSLPNISSKTSIRPRYTFVSLSTSMTIMSSTRLPSGLDENFRKDFIIIEGFLLPFLVLNTWPSISSISCSSKAWSPVSIGTTEISRTARNWPQLFRCSFSRRKKFQMKRLQPEKKRQLNNDKRKVTAILLDSVG